MKMKMEGLTMIDKKYCMSSYMALRYIEREDINFYDNGRKHKHFVPVPEDQKILVSTIEDIDRELQKQVDPFKDKKKGILLSGGMDSGIVASYLSGSDAYTFRFLNGTFSNIEMERAEYYCKYYNLKLHYVDINWGNVTVPLDELMKAKAAPVHSIEPQIYLAASQAKADGVEVMFVGESGDLVFGGMDGMLAKDWTFDEFVDRYIFTKPEEVLVDPESMLYVFEKYRKDGNMIDYMRFIDEIFAIESSSSYMNAFALAGMPYFDPYAKLKMADELDLYRVRHGESKYLLRALMHQKYPDIPVPDKIAMPRPVEEYFKNWEGPQRPEFRKDIDMSKFTGNQKWQMYCLERFLNINE
jgi:asparagine synthetase B (glutamine-hydrolysing)